MSKFIKSPDGIIQIFNSLCLSQVKEQLIENLSYFAINPDSFICNGHLYTISGNKSFILDESLNQYGIDINFSNLLN